MPYMVHREESVAEIGDSGRLDKPFVPARFPTVIINYITLYTIVVFLLGK